MTGISTLGQTLDQIERLKTLQLQLADFQTQLTTGKKTRTFSGLGTSIITSEKARADFTALNTYSNNITIADRRIKQMTAAVEKVREQAGSVLNALEIQTQKGEYDIETVSDFAGKTFDFIVNLLNQKDGDRYLFGGSDTLTPPVGNTGTLDTYVLTRLDSWVSLSIDTDQLIDSYRDRTQLNDTVVGYSAALSSSTVNGVSIRIDQTTEIDYTVLANGDGFRDILAGLSMVKQIANAIDEVTLDPADDPLTTTTAPGVDQQEQNDNFYKMFNDVATMLSAALDSLSQEEYKLSQVHAQVTQVQERHKLEQNTLAGVISDVEDADMNEVAVRLNALQIQLEASYRVTAAVQSLSIINFL